MASITVPISQLPNGVVSTIAALRAISTLTMSDGDYVTVLGSGTPNDTYQSSYIFSGACTQADNGVSVITNGNTGAWIRSIDTPFITISQTATYSGVAETFAILSGASAPIVYTLPPSYVIAGQPFTLKSLGTGQIIIKTAGNDLIFPANSTVTTTGITFNGSGTSYHFNPYQGVYYQV